MADIDVLAQYVLTNPILGSTNSLASTSMNDSLIVVPRSSNNAQSYWYFVETDDKDYYRLHTQQKGNFSALDVFNYNGKNTIDLHFYAVQDNTGQHWHLREQDDGSMKISNQFTGPDMYLDVVENTLQPTLAARDSPGMRWTLSKVRLDATATLSTASPTSHVIASGLTTLASSTKTANPIESSSATVTGKEAALSKDRLSVGVKGGIAAGVVVGVVALGFGIFLAWRSWSRGQTSRRRSKPPSIKKKPILNVSKR